jgi:DNA recombination protein RmuC
MLPFLLALTVLLLLLVSGAAVWLLANLRTARQQRDEAQSQGQQLSARCTQVDAEFAAARTEVQVVATRLQSEQAQHLQAQAQARELSARCGQLDAELAAARTEAQVAVARLKSEQANHEQALKKVTETFDALAAKALEQSSKQFLQLASQKFQTEQKDAAAQLEQRKQAIEQLVKPVRETLDKYSESLGKMEAARVQAYGSLKEQLEGMLNDQRRLRQETANLVAALRRPEVRGRWGEMQLRRVAELAGMIPNCDFTEQTSVTAGPDAARQRPDMVVKLPGGRTIVVDAKTPLDAFLSALEAIEDTQRETFFDQHAQQIETQVRRLAEKRYSDQFDRAPDFVVLFIPGESFLQAALQRRADLMESAFARGVVIATPATLIALLRAVALGWREQQIAENAQRISELGVELHERIATATGYIDAMGKNLEKTVKAYNSFVGSYESRVLSSARKFKDLGADSPKELPAESALPQIESAVREIKPNA